MRKCFFIGCVVLLCGACKPSPHTVEADPNVSVIAFGSCGHQLYPQPVLDKVVEQHPDVFVYLGDNIYSDTYSMDTLRMNYAVLAAKPEFKRLRAAMPILATWDDHDYGWNDSGRHYPHKAASKKIFLDFFGMPDSSVLQHDGIYYTQTLEKAHHRIKLIFLDLRTFRDKLLPYNGNRKDDARFSYSMEYSPYATTDSTMLGEAQWLWLEEQLRQPADLRIIASSTQFGITHNGYEAWANFPHEQQRLLDLIRKTKANGVMVISGDVHYAEISKLQVPGLYPIYDVTASGITSMWDFATPNDNRVDGPVMENHFGLLRIDWGQPDPQITMNIIDVSGRERIKRTISLSAIQF